MKNRIVNLLITALLKVITPDIVKMFINRIFEFVENKVKGTKSTVDDKIILPLCMMLHDAFAISDDDIRETTLSGIFGSIIETLTPDLLKEFMDLLLDLIEDAVKDSENKIDDYTVLPLCRMIRTSFNIPDND